jgi:aspartokinase-like uncharacterized kinase
LAVHAMSKNSAFLQNLFDLEAVLVTSREEWESWRQRNKISVLDVLPFLREDESSPGQLPHCWDVTSDSIGLRVAERFGVSNYVLLKSIDLPPGIDWVEAGERNFVDRYFARALQNCRLSGNTRVDWVNLRSWTQKTNQLSN